MQFRAAPKPNARVRDYERAWALLTRDNAIEITDVHDEAEFVRVRAALTHRVHRHFGHDWKLRQQRLPDGWRVWAEPRPPEPENGNETPSL